MPCTIARTSWASITKITTEPHLDPTVLGLCTFPHLSLLFDLKGLFHRSTNLLLQTVVVGTVLALDRVRRLSNGCLQLFLPRAKPLPCAMRWLLSLRSATNERLLARRGRTVRTTDYPMPSHGHCPSLQKRSDTTSRACVRILRFCLSRRLLRPSRWRFAKCVNVHSGED